MKKYVIVKEGYFYKIVDTWDECKKYTHKQKGMKFKSFNNNEELIEFLINNVKYDLDKTFEELNLPYNIIEQKMIDIYSKIEEKTTKNNFEENKNKAKHISNGTFKDIKDISVISYVDGSYNIHNGDYGYGICMLENDNIIFKCCGVGNDEEAKTMRQVMGELEGALKSVKYAKECNIKEICICYDYLGIEKWATNEWKANKKHTKEYKKIMMELYESGIDIYFYKVKAHSGVKYNEIADKLAKQGANLNLFNKYVVILDDEFETILDNENELLELLSKNSNYKYKQCKNPNEAYDYLLENTKDKNSIIDNLNIYGIVYKE